MSPAQASDAPVTEVAIANTPSTDDATIEELKQEPEDTSTKQELTKLQPVVKLDRLSKEDMSLMQQSLAKFVENKPKLAEELGISATANSDEESDVEVSRKSKRKERKSYKEEEDDEDYTPDQFTALVGPNKSRRSSTAPVKPDPVVVKPKLRRLEKKFVPVLEKLSIEELMETNTYDRFNRTVENVLKTADELDTTELGKLAFLCGSWGSLTMVFLDLSAEDGIIHEDFLLKRIVLQDLCSESAKLKSLGAMEMIPTEKLVRVLSILEINVRGGDRVSPITDVSI